MTFRALTFTLALALHPLAAQETIELKTPTGTLYGTLMMPTQVKAPMPVALIIAGSGPTDRDGNTPLLPGKNNSLLMLAETLAKQGIASLRYDKRGVAASIGAATKESDLRFPHYVNDATLWLDQLIRDPRFLRVMVIGHSEGSLIALMAAQRIKVDRVVSLSGAGRSALDVLDEQLSKQLAGSPLLEDSRRILAELKEGRKVDSVPQQLLVLYRPSVQPYLISWITIDPAEEIARVKVPVLVVQGTTDIQVTVADAERLAKANPAARLEIIDGMNHILKEVREGSRQMASYGDPNLPLHPRLVETLRGFVTAR